MWWPLREMTGVWRWGEDVGVADHSAYAATGISQTQVVINDLRQGHDTVLGTDTINGRPALHLGNDEPGMGREFWVDPSTYLLIRMTEHGWFGSTELDYTWIAKSDPNAAGLFLPQVPAGFTKVPKIHE
jgi:hypothetical protein